MARSKCNGHGGGAVTVWYSSKIANVRITSPYDTPIPGRGVYEVAKRQNFIDELILKQLELLHLPPSPPADDATFIRRAYSSTRLASCRRRTKSARFLPTMQPDKRDRLIDSLLARDGVRRLLGLPMVRLAAGQWQHAAAGCCEGVLRLDPRAGEGEHAVGSSLPGKSSLAKGSSIENGATNFYALHQDPEAMTENISQAFLGFVDRLREVS